MSRRQACRAHRPRRGSRCWSTWRGKRCAKEPFGALEQTGMVFGAACEDSHIEPGCGDENAIQRDLSVQSRGTKLKYPCLLTAALPPSFLTTRSILLRTGMTITPSGES